MLLRQREVNVILQWHLHFCLSIPHAFWIHLHFPLQVAILTDDLVRLATHLQVTS